AAGHRAGRGARRSDDVETVEHPPQGFVDLVGRIGPPELAKDLAKALAAFADRRRERTVELAVEKELPVLGIEGHDVRRQHVDREVRSELRNVLAVMQRRTIPGIALAAAGTRAAALFLASADCHREAGVLQAARTQRPKCASFLEEVRPLGYRVGAYPVDEGYRIAA